MHVVFTIEENEPFELTRIISQNLENNLFYYDVSFVDYIRVINNDFTTTI